MLEIFFPDMVADRIQDIELDKLLKRGIKGIVLDIDNTLVPNHVAEADENALQWIERVKERGFKICIVSNATRKRVVRFNQKLKLFAIHRAFKPSMGAFRKASRMMDVRPHEAAVIGDQIFTDIYGGNRAGMYTVLVKPIHRSESLFVRLKRYPEKIILSHYSKRKG